MESILFNICRDLLGKHKLEIQAIILIPLVLVHNVQLEVENLDISREVKMWS